MTEEIRIVSENCGVSEKCVIENIEDSVFEEVSASVPDLVKDDIVLQGGGKIESPETIDIDDIMFSPPFEYSELL